MKYHYLLITLSLILFPALSFGEFQTDNANLKIIAKKYAPVIFQEIDRGTKIGQSPRGREDFITGVDFDGDLIGNNNWENQLTHPLKAVVYHSVLETKTHYFISYSVYHPRDWNRYPVPTIVKPYSEHENDMENIQVVVAKRGEYSGVRMLLTQAHAGSDFSTVKNSMIDDKNDLFVSSNPLVLFNSTGKISAEGTHVGIFIERKGHGIYSLGNKEKISYKKESGKVTVIKKRRDGIPFGEKFPIIQYLASDNEPYEPTIDLKRGMKQKFENGVPYQLESIYNKFWVKFERGAPYTDGENWALTGDGKLFDKHFQYIDDIFKIDRVPRHFDSNKFSGPWKSDAGISPFSIGLSVNPVLPSEKSRIGMFFFNPAFGYAEFFKFPEQWENVYKYNPYLVSVLNKK